MLPVGYHRVVVSSRPYYYYQGTYYTQVTDQNKQTAYEVAAPPAGAVVPDLPDDVAQVTIDEQDLYEYDNTLYRKVATDEVEGYEVYGNVSGKD
ncbi:hypothetical protein M23134_00116 [Microscilla marina ATCC 23134]|uniref:Uncharacterized protein n=1 Tax=Microscilla marina ATCC 23134 TaxID=313606 RepID=A1ZKZ6_MICM2|nr:hypothetical protein M23134_00116 [Microscilla marina ATCC 23134]